MFKKIYLIFVVCLLVLQKPCFALERAPWEAPEYRSTPLRIEFYNGDHSDKVKNVYGLSLGLVATNNHKVYGLQISPGLNRISRMYGLQIGGINLTDEMRGIQIGFLPCPRELFLVSNEAAYGYGMQITPFINLSSTFYGLQIGSINSIEESGALIQLGLIFNNSSGDATALQIAPFNRVADYFTGGQFGIINFSNPATYKKVSGVQLGVYNSINTNSDITGLQIGIINVCRGTLKGLQLGLLNFGGRDALLPFTLGINAGF